MSEKETKVNWETSYRNAANHIIELEKENADLRLIEETKDIYEDKLHDEIDKLRQIIALLTKDWL